jgi:hypothetical protein
MGRLGSWPGDFGPEAAMNLAAVASQNLTPGALAVDASPGCGRSLVLLAAAAYRAGAKVGVVRDNMSPPEQLWFNRAFRLFKLSEAVRNDDTIAPADLVVVRNDPELARAVFASLLKPEGILVGLNIQQLENLTPEQSGNGWAVWRRPKTPELRVVKPEHATMDAATKDKQLDMRSFLPPDDPEYDAEGLDGVRADG